ncbi:DNA primase family protein [Veillonella seminalis]|uniref:DNA primase family protein n=1 Tax=Veillonella seminalis TaxID=1502943 RepID=UPI00402A804E
MELYKGYIKTKNKRAAEKFKGLETFKTYDEVKAYDEFAGILAEDTILIDIDNKAQSDDLMNIVQALQLKCRVYETTRGRHFLFKNSNVDKCSTKSTLAIGLLADIKIGSKASYEVLKYEGVEREKSYDTGDYESLPVWLLPIKGGKKFDDLVEGDGRNQAFFNYILTLQSAGLGIEDIRTCIRLINRYVLKEPLSDEELEVILRDDAFQKESFYTGRTFNFDVFATFLKNTYRIIRIDGQLHYYKDGIYIKGMRELEHLMIKYIPNLNQAKRREVLAYLDALILDNTPMAPAHLIAFRNGILNVGTMELLEYSPSVVLVNKIDWDYNPNAYDELVDKTLDKISCNNKEIRANLEETVGYCLFRRNELGKAVILTGEGSNGKSTYLKMIQAVLGDDNISALDLKEIGDRFSTVMIYQKLANIGDDISGEYIPDTAVFRKVVTGDTITAEQKGQPKFEFKPYCKLIFSSNNIPRLGKGCDFSAVKRRLIIIPFNAKFSKDDPDFVPYIIDELKAQTAIEYFIVLAIEGLKRVLANKAFTESVLGGKELATYENMVDTVKGFLEEYKLNNFINQPVKDVHRAYEIYCEDNKLTAIGRNFFVTRIKKITDLKVKQQRVNGKRIQVFHND